MSRLPEDGAYWAALTDRLVRDAAGQLRDYRGGAVRRRPGLARLARWSAPLAVGAAAAVIAALLWLPVAREPARAASPAAIYGLAPNDPLAALFVTSADAPTMATLMATPTSEGAR